MKNIKFLNILDASDELQKKVREWRNKETVRHAMLNQNFITEEDHVQWLKNLKTDESRKFWIVFFDDVPIGSIYLQNIHYEELSSEWGFYIGEDEFRNRGLGKQILKKMMKIFFDEMGFKLLITKVLSNNDIALGIYKKFHFRETRRLPYDGKREVIVMEFSDKDWIDFREGGIDG